MKYLVCLLLFLAMANISNAEETPTIVPLTLPKTGRITKTDTSNYHIDYVISYDLTINRKKILCTFEHPYRTSLEGTDQSNKKKIERVSYYDQIDLSDTVFDGTGYDDGQGELNTIRDKNRLYHFVARRIDPKGVFTIHAVAKVVLPPSATYVTITCGYANK